MWLSQAGRGQNNRNQAVPQTGPSSPPTRFPMEPRLGTGWPCSCPRFAGNNQPPPPHAPWSGRGWGGVGCCQRSRPGAGGSGSFGRGCPVAVKKAGCFLRGRDAWTKAATSWTLGPPFLGSEKGGGCQSPPAVGPRWPWPCWDACGPPAVEEEPLSLLGQLRGGGGFRPSCFVSNGANPKSRKVPRVLGGGRFAFALPSSHVGARPASWVASLLVAPRLSPPSPCPLVPGGATALVPSAGPGRRAGGPVPSSGPGTNDRLPAGDCSLRQAPGR